MSISTEPKNAQKYVRNIIFREVKFYLQFALNFRLKFSGKTKSIQKALQLNLCMSKYFSDASIELH